MGRRSRSGNRIIVYFGCTFIPASVLPQTQHEYIDSTKTSTSRVLFLTFHSSLASSRLYVMHEIKFVVDAILFDMDGTLIDSTAGVTGAWDYWGKKYPHLNIHEILRTSHGVRTIDNLRKWNPEIPEDQLEAHVNEFEIEIVNSSKRNEAQGQTGIILLPGVQKLIDSLGSLGDWAICTSAATAYATAALKSVNLPVPAAFVTADDVTNGKPFPDPYILGAAKCKAKPERCLVVEDAPSGVASGKAAGAQVLAVCTSHTRERMQQTEPDILVNDLTSVSLLRLEEGGFQVTITSPILYPSPSTVA